MTRESKVAIILGFAVVLVVAALISDHFSHARQARIGNALAQGTPKDFGADSSGLTEPIGETKGVLVRESGANAPSGAGGSDSGRPPAAPTRPDEILMKGDKQKNQTPDQPNAPQDEEGPSMLPPEQAIAGDLPFTDKKAMPYQVKENDSLYRIAKASYGDGTLWQELGEYNKGKVGTNNALRAGATIVIPPKDVLLGKARLRPEGSLSIKETRIAKDIPKREPTIKDPTTKPPTKDIASKDAPPKHMMYTVRKGDHLSTIAQRLLGSSRRVSDILKLNPNLDDEDSIREGMLLRVPKN